jgi:hypothetical protein
MSSEGPTDDANAAISAELGHVLSLGSDLAMVLSGDMATSLADLPFSEGVAAPEWNVSDASALAQMHRLFRLGGAAAAITHTEHCCELELEGMGLAHCADAAIENAVRAAVSAAPRYVIGAVTGIPIPPADPAPAEETFSSLRQQAIRLEGAGVHGYLAHAASFDSAEQALRAIREVSLRPAIAGVSLSALPSSAPDDRTRDDRTRDERVVVAGFNRLASSGADALSVEVPLSITEKDLSFLSRLAAERGRVLHARLVCDDRARASASSLQRAIADAARVLVDSGVRLCSLGPGFACGDTALLVDALRPHIARRGWRFVA